MEKWTLDVVGTVEVGRPRKKKDGDNKGWAIAILIRADR